MSAPWRGWFNRWRRRIWHALAHRIVFGEFDPSVAGARGWRPSSRIAPSACIEHAEHLALADHVYIGPFCFLEASGGLTLEEGVQLTHHVSIVTHSSHRALRLLRRDFVAHTGAAPRPGWIAAPVRVGAWSFIGPHSLLEAGTELGEGCLVRAGSVLRGRFPAHAVIAGNPAVVVGDAREGDARARARGTQAQGLDAGRAGRAGGDEPGQGQPDGALQ